MNLSATWPFHLYLSRENRPFFLASICKDQTIYQSFSIREQGRDKHLYKKEEETNVKPKDTQNLL